MINRNAPRFTIGVSALSIALGSASGALAQATSPTAPPSASTLALQAQTEAEAKNRVSNSIDLSGSVGYSSNSYLDPTTGGSSNGSLFGRISALATHSVISNRSTVNVSAYVENQTYITENRGSTPIFDLNANIRYVLTPRLDVYGSAGFSGDIGGQLNNRFTSLPSTPAPVDTTNPLPPINVLDPNLISLNRRQYRASGQAGLSYKLTERDFVNATVGFARVFFTRSDSTLGYRTLNGSLGWNRVLSERATVGLRVSASRSDYRAGDDTTIISPAVTASLQLAEDWSLSGAVGASFVKSSFTTAGKSRSTSFSGDVSICKSGELERLCAGASRSTQASIGQNVVTVTAATLSYSRRIGALSTIQVSADVSRSSGGDSLLIARKSTYYGLNASFDRKLSQRLSTGINGSIRRVERTGGSIPTDTSGSIFLRYRLGDLQ